MFITYAVTTEKELYITIVHSYFLRFVWGQIHGAFITYTFQLLIIQLNWFVLTIQEDLTWRNWKIDMQVDTYRGLGQQSVWGLPPVCIIDGFLTGLLLLSLAPALIVRSLWGLVPLMLRNISFWSQFHASASSKNFQFKTFYALSVLY